jgi:hypothetical protein
VAPTRACRYDEANPADPIGSHFTAVPGVDPERRGEGDQKLEDDAQLVQQAVPPIRQHA